MNIFLDIFFTVFITLLVPHAGFSKTAGNGCVRLEFADFEDNGIEVNEDGYVHISFVITDNCQSEFFRVKVSTMSRDLPTTFCTIVFYKNACNITDKSLTCHCIKKEFMFTSISKKISLADKVLIEWNDNRSSKGEKSVFLFVNGSTTKPNTEKMEASVIISICCSIVLVLVIGVAIIKIRKCRDFVENYIFMKQTHMRYAVVIHALLLPVSPTPPRQQNYIRLGFNLDSQMVAIWNQHRKTDLTNLKKNVELKL